MDRKLQILLIDDDEEEYLLLKDLFSRPPNGTTLPKYDLDWVSTYEEALREFSNCQHDLYLVDYQLGGYSGLDLLRETAARECKAPIVILTGQGGYDIDFTAMQFGAADYLEKGQLTLPVLERSIRYAIDRKLADDYLGSLLQERAQDVALLRKQAQEMNALQKATSSLLNTLDLSALIAEILDAAQEAIPAAERGWLHLVKRNNSPFGKLAEMGFDDPRIHKTEPLQVQCRILESAYKDNRTLIADTGAEPLLLSLLDKEKDRQSIRSAITAPLVLGGEILGALSLSASRPSAFSEANLNLLTSFAATATAAIHNAILYAETQNLAATDPLTGQFNRRTLFEFGQREVERYQRFGHPLSVLMFDVDNFKKVNDTYGHAAGDQVLISIVERCCSVIRKVDILGRYGGDEFVLLLPEADQYVATEIADRIGAIIADSPVITDADPISVTISIGIAQATEDDTDLTVLLNRADQALYQSKQGGRNRTTSAT